MRSPLAAVAAVAAAALLAGCLREPEPDGGQFCTLIGCQSQVTFQVSTDLVRGVRYRVDACVDEVCHSEELVVPTTAGPEDGTSAGSLALFPRDDSIILYLGEGEYSGEREVSLTVETADGEDVAQTHVAVQFERSQPNGPGCEPVCWIAQVVI